MRGRRKVFSSRVTLDEDGKYRWAYEIHLFRNPTFFWLVWKIFFFILLGIFAVVFLIDIGRGWETAFDTLRMLGWFLIGMTVLVGLGYLVYAAMMGGRYVAQFEMDEKGVNHRQAPAQARKAKRIGRATIAAGIATGRPSTIGAGMSAQRTEMYSDFERTRKVKAFPHRNLIKVNGLLSHNQVYAPKEDFEFVLAYIRQRCPRLHKNESDAGPGQGTDVSSDPRND